MSSVYRQNSMMAMLDAKPEEKGNEAPGWNDTSEHLSPVRQRLIKTFLLAPDEEAMPLLGEYLGVALSFVALGALIRSSNSSSAKTHKGLNDEERLDLRACSRFERMALESMLKEAMERLRVLALNAFHMEERVRDLIAEDIELDKERVQLLRHVADAENVIQELRALRKAEGRANERVMCIVASKEQEWLKEKRTLEKEVQKLKENLSVTTQEAKFQARRCRNSNCEHCKGLDRVVRNVKGRISLRDLNLKGSLVIPKPEVLKAVRHLEAEEDRCLINSTECKAVSEQSKMKRNEDWPEKISPSKAPNRESAGEADQSGTSELVVKQQQDMESELASILKRVGMLKQRSSPESSVTRKQDLATDKNNHSSADKMVAKFGKVVDAHHLQGNNEVPLGSKASESSAHDTSLEYADYLSDQEDYFSVGDEEEINLVELDKAFELKDDKDELLAPEPTEVALGDRAKVERDSPAESEMVIERHSGEITSVSSVFKDNVHFGALESNLRSEGFGFVERLAELRRRSETIDSRDFDFFEYSSSDLNVSQDHLAHTEDLTPVGLERSFSEIVRDSQVSTVLNSESFPVILERSASELLQDCIQTSESGRSSEVMKFETGESTEHAFAVSSEDLTKMSFEAGKVGPFLDFQEITGQMLDVISEDTKAMPSTGVIQQGSEVIDTIENLGVSQNILVDENLEVCKKMPEQALLFDDEMDKCPQARGSNDEQRIGFEAVECHRRKENKDEFVQMLDSVAGREHCHEASGFNCDHEQMLGIVSQGNGNEMYRVENRSLDVLASVGSANASLLSVDVDVSDLDQHDQIEYESRLDVRKNSNYKTLLSSSEEVENQDIPLFERHNPDDSVGELPEPEEKRVCSSGMSDLTFTGSPGELCSHKEESSLKEILKDNVNTALDSPEEKGSLEDDKGFGILGKLESNGTSNNFQGGIGAEFLTVAE